MHLKAHQIIIPSSRTGLEMLEQLFWSGSFSSCCIKVVTHVMLIIFLIICNNYTEIYIYHGYIIYKADITFSQCLFLYQHTFSNFEWDAVCELGHIELTAEALKPFVHAMFQHHRLNNVLRVHPSGGKTNGSWNVLNLDCRKNKEDQIQNADFCSKSRLVSSRTLKDLVSGILEEVSNQSDMCRH